MRFVGKMALREGEKIWKKQLRENMVILIYLEVC